MHNKTAAKPWCHSIGRDTPTLNIMNFVSAKTENHLSILPDGGHVAAGWCVAVRLLAGNAG
jgi:hypothetical protein